MRQERKRELFRYVKKKWTPMSVSKIEREENKRQMEIEPMKIKRSRVNHALSSG